MMASVLNEYGMLWVLNRTLYGLKLKTLSKFPRTEKLFEKSVPTTERVDLFDINIELLRDSLLKMDETDKKELIKKADNACDGKIKIFSSLELDYGYPINWQLNPMTGIQSDKNKHWFEIADFDKKRGDIKIIWEPSRFSHMITIARAYVLTNDIRYYMSFSNQIDAWVENNKYSYGANFKCGQECSIRMINVLMAYSIFKSCNKATYKDRDNVRYIVNTSYKKILSNFFYAYKCIKNNHTISEIMGMIAGAWCHNDSKTLKKAYEYLEEVINDQFTSDGGYAQYSFNYQRLALQDLNIIISIEKKTGIKISEESRKKINASAKLMYQCSLENGDMPNYGSNDGALIFPFTSCRYRDYRPVIQTTIGLLENTRTYDDDKIDEELIWHGINPSKLQYKIMSKASSAFKEAGIYTLRRDNIFMMFVANDYKKRPAHMDQLHIDLWVDGINVFCDSGTYSYASVEGQNLIKTSGHNTIKVEGREQMNYKPPFMVYDRTEVEKIENGNNYITATVRSKNGYRHMRCVELNGGEIVITDNIEPQILNYESLFHTPCEVEKTDADNLILNYNGNPVIRMQFDSTYQVKNAIRSTYYMRKEEIRCIHTYKCKKIIIETINNRR